MKAKEIADKAGKLVAGDRSRTHGEWLVNYQNVAYVWNGILMAAGILKKPMTALDAVHLMEGLKIARRYSGAHNIDDYIDGAGYAAGAGEIASDMQKRGAFTPASANRRR
jgi:hypothetical protein